MNPLPPVEFELALDRETRELRSEVCYAASELGEVASNWKPSQGAASTPEESSLAKVESALAVLQVRVERLRNLQVRVESKCWKPEGL